MNPWWIQQIKKTITTTHHLPSITFREFTLPALTPTQHLDQHLRLKDRVDPKSFPCSTFRTSWLASLSLTPPSPWLALLRRDPRTRGRAVSGLWLGSTASCRSPVGLWRLWETRTHLENPYERTMRMVLTSPCWVGVVVETQPFRWWSSSPVNGSDSM